MKKEIYLILFLLIVSASSLRAQELKVASYNIRYANSSDSINGNGWQQRCPVITQLLLFNDFDIIGMQEVLDKQKNDLQKALPQYEHVGVGREDGKTKGEYASIFYKKDKFDMLQSGYFWLSQNTDYPNAGWDASMERICTWVQLKDKANNANIWFFNLHMDHIGKEARTESSKLVIRKIKELCNKEPIILTGDFNFDQYDSNYAIFTNSEILTDSYEVCKVKYALTGTFNNYDINKISDARIDHVFVSSDFTVDRYGILTDIYWADNSARLPSDHFPVSVVLKYNKIPLY